MECYKECVNSTARVLRVQNSHTFRQISEIKKDTTHEIGTVAAQQITGRDKYKHSGRGRAIKSSAAAYHS